MKAENHNCKTAFIGGANIFHASQHLAQSVQPAEPFAVEVIQKREEITQKREEIIQKREEIINILSTGYFTLAALSKKTGITTTACYERLKRLAREGSVKSRQCVGTRAREYTLGRPSEATLTVTEQVLNVIRSEPFITSGQISKKLGIPKTTNVLARLVAQGVITRRKDRLRIYVYYIA